MPERCIQGGLLVPPSGRAIRFPCRIFELIYRSRLRERAEVRHVAEEGVCFVDVEIPCIHFVQSEAAVKICQRGYAGSNPASGQSIFGILNCAVVRVVYHELIFMRVAEEYVCNNMRGVAVYNLVEEIRGIRERVGTIPSRENMANKPNTLATVLCFLKLGDHPSKDTGVVRVCYVDEI